MNMLQINDPIGVESGSCEAPRLVEGSALPRQGLVCPALQAAVSVLSRKGWMLYLVGPGAGLGLFLPFDSNTG